MTADLATKRAAKPALVRVKGLHKRYTQRRAFSQSRFVVDALRNVDLELQPECLTALVGASGSGKSTLASCLAMLEKPDAGEIWFEEREISRCGARELVRLRPRIQMVFQDSGGALNPFFSAAQIVAEPLEVQYRKVQHRESRRKLHQRACELMEEVGLPADWADRSPLQLSGGQRQRLAIARALALQPTLLILDESLSGLDLVTQAQILNLLADIRITHSLTYLLITHDLSLVGQVADYIAVMHQGTIVEHGTMQCVFGNPQHAHTRALLDATQHLESAFRAAQPEVRR
jgi:ABC-type glutathione transport system ATPase component